MIILTKINGSSCLINLETIKYIEQSPDSVVFFTNGESIIVTESITDIQRLVEKHKTSILKNALKDSGKTITEDAVACNI